MSDLTSRQREILNFIREAVRESRIPPTRTDICQAFGFGSPNAAESHLRALAAKGYIELVPGSSRNIRLLDEAEEALSRQFELPLVGRIAAGGPITAEQNIDSWLRIDPDLFRPRADFLHQIAGDSMIDAGILDGDLVGIHAQPEADNGQIIAAVLPDPATGDDLITLKRYFRRRNLVTLKAENARYAPIEIDLAAAADRDEEQPVFRIAGIFGGLIRAPR